jgi:hypothetical protein
LKGIGYSDGNSRQYPILLNGFLGIPISKNLKASVEIVRFKRKIDKI